MDANDDKINSVVALGRQLIDENNYASDKIQQKADSLEDRWHLQLLILLLLWASAFVSFLRAKAATAFSAS